MAVKTRISPRISEGEEAPKPAARAEKPEVKAKVRAADNVVFVGTKPTMSYVLAIVTQFGEGQKEVQVKARGKAIGRAVDVAEVVRNRFAKDAKVKGITIGTDRIKTQEGKEINVSTIEITLTK